MSTKSHESIKEKKIVQRVFHAQGVRVKVGRPIVTPSFTIYPLQLHPRETVKRVKGVVPQVDVQLSNVRMESVRVRVQTPPLFLEVQNREPRVLRWEDQSIPGSSLLAGRGYTFKGAGNQIVNLDKSPHCLVAGTTGSGKSVLLKNLVLSFLLANSPEDSLVILIDLKNEDLPPLRDLPHVAGYAGDPSTAEVLIDHAYGEVKKRRDSFGKPKFRLLIIIDEIAHLTDKSKETLNKVLSLGRSLKVNVISATQYPTAGNLGGGEGKINYTTRFVGLLPDADSASRASGRRESGAEFLPGDGAFIRVEGPDMIRFQSYLIEEDLVPRVVSRIASRWNGFKRFPWDPTADRPGRSAYVGVPDGVAVPAVPSGTYVTPEDLIVGEADRLRRLHALFEKHATEDGRLKGGTNAMLRAWFGEDAKTGGRAYIEQKQEVVGLFRDWRDGDRDHFPTASGSTSRSLPEVLPEALPVTASQR